MNNRDILDRFEQAHGAIINKMFWIPGAIESSDLADFLQYDCTSTFLEKLLPNSSEETINDCIDNQETSMLFVDNNRLGLVAEIHLPQCDNFSYDKKGTPRSWSIHGGICRIKNVYGDTLEELLTEIEKVSEEVFQDYIKEDKTKKQKEVS